MVLTFPKVILGLQTLFYRDFGVLAYPAIFYHHESFWRGEFPLWNPLSNCGAPFLAQWGTMVLYPFSLLYLLLPLPWSVNFFCLAHLFWAGLGMYFLASRWVQNGFASTIAGIGFVFSGVTFSSLIWPNYTVALGWMPWVVLWVERAWREGGRQLVIASIVSALQLLSGVPEIVLLTWLLLLGLGIGALVQRSVSPKHLVGRTLGIMLVVSCLTAAQLWPFFDLLAHSQRSMSFGTAKWAMPAWGWANFVVPLFRCFLTPQGIFFQTGQEFMSSTYPGIGVVLWAIFGILFVRQRRIWLLGGLALLSVIMAMGENGVFYGILKRVLPLMGFARYPIKFIVLTAFVLPLLAASAIRQFEESPISPRRTERHLLGLWLGLLVVIGLLLGFARQNPLPLDHWPATWSSGVWRSVFLTAIVVLFLAQRRRTGTAIRLATKLGLIVLFPLDFLTHSPPQNPTLASSVLEPGLWRMNNQASPPTHGEGRVLISPRAEQHLLMSGVPNLRNDFLGKRLALWSNLNLIEGIPKVNGSSTLQLREQSEVQALLYASTNTDLPRLADFLSVSQMTAPGQILEWTSRDTYLPLVTVGPRPIFAGPVETLKALTNSDFRPSQTVYLPLEAQPFIQVTNGTTGKILSWKFSARRIELEVEVAQPSLLVVAQSFYHPWRAYVDGKRTVVWRANQAFQAVEVLAGSRHVQLVYEDWVFRSGAFLSGITLLLCVGWLVFLNSQNCCAVTKNDQRCCK